MGLPSPEHSLAAVCPDVAARATDCEYLGVPDGKKNRIVAFTLDGQQRVLKVFRQDWAYRVQVWRNPLSRWVSRAFALRSGARARVQAELDGIAGFRAAGFGTFDVLARPQPHVLVFRREEGLPLLDRIREIGAGPETRSHVAHLADDLRRRQESALAADDRRMVHPAPRLAHAWWRPSGELVYFDFEARVNPSLSVPEALPREVEAFFFSLLRNEATSDAATIGVAVDAVGTAALDRWRAHHARDWRWRLSGSRRRRRDVLARVVGSE